MTNEISEYDGWGPYVTGSYMRRQAPHADVDPSCRP